jgi:hypothetical protein
VSVDKRSALNQITIKKGRAGHSAGHISGLFLFEDLKRKWEIKSDRDFDEFAIIKMVTILEIFLRDSVRDMVDESEIFAEKADLLIRNAKIDFSLLRAFNGGSISFGDFVAHSVSVSSYDSIISILGALIDSFVPRLRMVHPRWIEEREEWPLDPIIKDFSYVSSRVGRLLETRHILVHELPNEPPFSREDVEEFFDATTQFVDACSWLITECLQGAVAKTQSQMNAISRKMEDDIRVEMDELVRLLHAGEPPNLSENQVDTIDGLQEFFMKYSESYCNLFAGDLIWGGSIRPVIYGGAMQGLLRDHIARLKELNAHWGR